MPTMNKTRKQSTRHSIRKKYTQHARERTNTIKLQRRLSGLCRIRIPTTRTFRNFLSEKTFHVRNLSLIQRYKHWPSNKKHDCFLFFFFEFFSYSRFHKTCSKSYLYFVSEMDTGRIRSGVEPVPGFIFWTRSRLTVFESKPYSDFSLNLKPKNYISLILSMIEKRNI